jgi:hypothetical protein
MTFSTPKNGVWRKSIRSNQQPNGCVEVMDIGDGVAIRDSKDPAGPVLLACADAWREFLSFAAANPRTSE